MPAPPRPKLRHRPRLVLAAAVACMVVLPTPAASAHVAAIGACPNERLAPTPTNIPAIRAAARCLVNLERRAHGVPGLLTNIALQNAAQRWAQSIVNRRSCSHGNFYSRLAGSGYRLPGRPIGFGEALGWDYGDRATPRAILLDRAVVGAAKPVLSSPLHHGWLIGRSFQHIGIGVVAAVCQDGSANGATYVFDVGRRR